MTVKLGTGESMQHLENEVLFTVTADGEIQMTAMPSVIKNPSPASIERIISASEQKAAKWIKETETGDLYYFPAERYQHMEVAYWLKVRAYSKGVEMDKLEQDEKQVIILTDPEEVCSRYVQPGAPVSYFDSEGNPISEDEAKNMGMI